MEGDADHPPHRAGPAELTIGIARVELEHFAAGRKAGALALGEHLFGPVVPDDAQREHWLRQSYVPPVDSPAAEGDTFPPGRAYDDQTHD